MLDSLLYLIPAILGLSFLIFIHELGHYWMARRVGMRVEVFAIGFGKAIYSWEHDGTRWQIGWLPFGGYVKIAGTDNADEVDPYEVPDGFFGKSPLDRIKVAFMGPFVNLLFALLVFAALWLIGGREKSFSEYTHKIGWLDPQSELFAHGVRPGDEIISYDDKPYQGLKDHLYEPMTGSSEIKVKGFKVDYAEGLKNPFEYKVKVYPHPYSFEKGLKTAGILGTANYVIYEKLPSGRENPLPEGSPMKESGIEYGDRIVWADGEAIFSAKELEEVLNDGRALLTVQRGSRVFLRRAPRIQVQELKIDHAFKNELTDWQFEAKLNAAKITSLYVIPYNLNNEGVVESELKYIDKDKQEQAFGKKLFSELDEPLEVGDKILAVDGTPVQKSFELLNLLQGHRVNLIIQRNPEAVRRISSQLADSDFDRSTDRENMHKIAASIGTDKQVTTAGDLLLLHPVQPKTESEILVTPENQAAFATNVLLRKKEIEGIEDPEKRAQALHLLEQQENQLLLGIRNVQDRKVNYNPLPMDLFRNVLNEITRTLGALVSGSLNPKWLSGPIGIVQVVHDNSMVSLKEALFWIGAISLNLGILNLMPIPVLDGGTILMSLIEMITRKRIHPKTMEKVILPFAVLLVLFFVFLTYHDLSRIFGSVWR